MRRLFKKKILLLSFFGLIVLGSFGIWQLFGKAEKINLPNEISTEAMAIASLGRDISSFGFDEKSLNEIKSKLLAGSHSDIISTIEAELRKSKVIELRSIELLKKLELAGISLDAVTPETVKQSTFKALEGESQVVRNFVNYRNDLDEFLRLVTSNYFYGGDDTASLDTLIERLIFSKKAMEEKSSASANILENLGK